MLQLDDISVTLGGVTALSGVSFDVPAGQVCALIGPNGAGKSSLLNVITGIYRPSSGQVHVDSRDVLTTSRKNLAALGLARTFQNVALFHGLTVLENVLVGAHARSNGGFLGCSLRLPSVRASERTTRKHCRNIMHRVGLSGLADRAIAELSFGAQKRVELARALAAEPRLLMLDEPAAGLQADEIEELVGLLRELRDADGLTLVLVEHHMNLVMTLSDRVVALNFGEVIADGAPTEVGHDPAVVEAYLGRTG